MKSTNDYQSLQRIVDISVEPDFVIELDEKYPGVENQSFWLMLKSKTGVVEGKLHLPEIRSDKLVIFEPGFPGGGSTQLEQLWLKKLLQHQWSVFAARHGGTIVNGKYSETYLNCRKRQELSKQKGFDVLGNKSEHTIADWLKEPFIALEALAPHFTKVILCGHSFGPLALFYSLTHLAKGQSALLKRITRIVSLAGSVGRIRQKNDPILKVWFEHLNTQWAKDRVSVGDAKINTRIFGKAHNLINEQVKVLPEHMTFLMVCPWGDKDNSTDEIVHPIESIDLIASIGRGYLILDKKEWGEKNNGRMAHDMEALPAETFLNFISDNWLPDTHISVIN